MELKKTWERWTQKTKEFPKPKYNFSFHLRSVGDHVITNPMTEPEYQKIKDAAKFWAWRHDKRVRIKKNKVGKGLYEVVITLIAQHRRHMEEPKWYEFPDS